MKTWKAFRGRLSFPLRMVVLLLLGGALWGCAGGSQYTVDEARIARGYLSIETDVPNHPDSLGAVKVVEKERTVDIQLGHSYEQLMRNWSSTWVSQTARRSSNLRIPYKSFATLWSLDLSVASLVVEQGVEGLSKELALKRIQQRKEEHQQAIQIDLYRFVGSPPTGGGISSTLVGRPGSHVVLRDDRGNEYRPADVYNSPPRETIIAGQRAIYRRNTFVFRREVDERDILEGVQTLRLFINQSSGGRYYFTWSFEDFRETASSQ